MPRKKIILFFALVFFNSSFLFAQSMPEETPAVLEELIVEAKRSNPQILAAYNDWIAEEHRIKQVKSLPDPRANFSYFGENIETKVGPQEAKYGLSQKIPFPGKLGLKGKTAQKQSQMMKEKYEAVEREIVKRVKFTYYDIWWADKAIQTTEEEKAILESLEEVVQRKYESNLTPQQDVLKVQVELSRLIDKLFLLRQNRKSLAAKMNSILDRTRGRPLGKTGDLQAQEFKYQLDQLHKIAKDTSQQLLAANLDIERAEYEKSLAKMDYLPDFTFGFDYIRVDDGHTTLADDGQDAWMGKVSVNLPIWFNKLKAQVEEKEAKLVASKKNYQSVENNITFEVEDLYFKINTYKDIIKLYETALIPQTEQSFQAAKTAYETARVDFLNWLDAERAVLQTRLAYYKSIADYQKSIAYLERVVGKDL